MWYLEKDGIQTLNGGAIKVGETTEQAVVREFFEETNLKVKVNELVAVIENLFQYDNERYQQIIFVYRLSLAEEEQEFIVEKGIKSRWLTKNEITDLKPDSLNQLIQGESQGIQHIVNKEI